MSKTMQTPVNNIIIKVCKRDWTDYTINDYVDALGRDFDLAMKIREELYPGISKICPVKKPKGEI